MLCGFLPRAGCLDGAARASDAPVRPRWKIKGGDHADPVKDDGVVDSGELLDAIEVNGGRFLTPAVDRRFGACVENSKRKRYL